ncbi:hypothetical protein ACIRBX_12255 [Kitasatospora sp. NPDC096147]
MSEIRTDSSDHESTGTENDRSEAAHGRHRGGTAADDRADANPHGRHRR